MSVDMTERFAFVYVLPFSFCYVVVQKIDYIFNKCFFHNSFNSFNPLSLFTHPPFRKVKPVKCVEQGVNEVNLVRRLWASLHNSAQV